MRSRRAELTILLAAGLLLVGAGAWAGAWPEPPATVAPQSLSGEAARDYRFAAGLYRALAREVTDGNPALLGPADAARVARALLTLGQGDLAAERFGGRDDLPSGLRLLLALQRDPSGWSAADRERWGKAWPGGDGESVYWRARADQALDESEGARSALNALLGREPGSVFAPAALELLQDLPAPETLSANRGAPGSRVEPASGGLRVQWGVFRDVQGARRLREAVSAYGQQAELLRFRQDGRELFRVCSPPFPDDAEADARALGESLRQRYGLDFVLHRSEESGASP